MGRVQWDLSAKAVSLEASVKEISLFYKQQISKVL